MIELRDRLVDLASTADAEPDQGTARLARERYRTYRRRRRVGTAVLLVACAAVVAAVTTTAWVRSADPRPADSDGQPALPDRIYHASPWLPGTDDAGPLGTVAAAIQTGQGSWSGVAPGLLAVSATTGKYRFLDLDRAVLSQDWALSPDGRHVAYWTTGETAGSPNLDSGPPVTGVAVYDTVSGETTEHPVATDHGLWPDVLVWAGADRLVFGYGQYLGGQGDSAKARSSGSLGPRFVWDLRGSPRALAVPNGVDIEAAGPGFVLTNNGDEGRYFEIGLDTAQQRLVDLGKDTSTWPVMDETGRRVAVVAGLTNDPHVSGKRPNAVRAGYVGGPVPRVPGSSHTFDVVGWVDAHHVAVRKVPRNSWTGPLRSTIEVLDLRDGSARRVMVVPGMSAPQLATDLLGLSPRKATRPPRPLDPRVTTGAIVLSLVLAGGGSLWWRRRVRP